MNESQGGNVNPNDHGVSFEKRLLQGAEDFVHAIVEQFRDERGVHLETAIAAASGMAGQMLLRGTGINFADLESGSVVLVDGLDEKGSELLNYMMELCSRAGIDPESGWTDTPPEENAALFPVIDMVRDLMPAFLDAARNNGVPEELRPTMAAATAVMLVSMGREALEPDIAKAVAVWNMVAGARTVPHHEGG